MKGLYDKYEVYEDGEPVEGFTFVLKPETDFAARVALKAYADATENEALSDDLIEFLFSMAKEEMGE